MKRPNQSIASTDLFIQKQSTADPNTEDFDLDQRNRLFGDLAILNGFIEQNALNDVVKLLEGSNKTIGDALVERGELTVEDRRAIDQLLNRRLVRNREDPQASLVSLASTIKTIRIAETRSFPTMPSNSSKPHDCFGDYELIGELGKGGMGVVYKARHSKLGRLVALKMIRSGELADEEQVTRFYGEAKAAAKLDHPGIVPVYEVGEIEGRHFFSMAIVDGHSLNQEAQDSPLDPREAAGIVDAVAEALQFAHQNGIVHRDIKPGNILLDVNQRPRITDFGLAKHVYGDSQLTEAGLVIGTPSYMAPEQADGRSHLAGAPADVYSLGATLYYLLTGRPPIQSASKMETIRQVIETEPAPPRRLNPAIPRDLETICLKCLRKEPASRYASAGELSADIQRWLDNKPIHARRATVLEKSWLWCKRWPSVAGSIAVLVLAAIVVGGVLVGQHRTNNQRMAVVMLAADEERANSHVSNVLTAPPDGLPYAIELLQPLKGHALPRLEQLFDQGELTRLKQLRAAIALAKLGDVRDEFLVSQLKTAPDNQSVNLTASLVAAPNALRRIQQEVETIEQSENPDLRHLARLAIVAIRLGDTSIAQYLTAPTPNPTKRTIFIDTIPKWRADLNGLAQVVRTVEHPSLQYALLLGVAQLDSDHQELLNRTLWQSVLVEMFADSPHPAVHGASDFALRRLGLPVPASYDGARLDVGWTVNSAGMTMVQIPAGSFERDVSNDEDGRFQVVTLARPFWLADKEATHAQLAEFRGDTSEPAEAVDGTSGAKNSPAVEVSWDEAVRYCNWLSQREGRAPCYSLVTGEWKWDTSADGYRLPTEAEWEYAAHAGTTTCFSHGDDDDTLAAFAVYRVAQPNPCGSKLPNGNGLFDMHGNLREWCFDRWSENYGGDTAVSDPRGPTTGRNEFVQRGGGFRSSLGALDSAARSFANRLSRRDETGFRVARNHKPAVE